MIINKQWLGRVFRNPEPGEGGGGPVDPPADPAPQDPPADPVDPPSGNDPPADPAPQDPPAASFMDAPQDWRTQIVASMGIEDEAERGKVETMLSRVTDFKSFAKNYVEAQNKIRSGLAKDNTLPENPTDEQLKEYREANNIPESAEGYELSLDEGLVLGEEDNRIMGEVFKAAHGMNLSTEQVSQLTNSMLNARQVEEQAYAQQDGIDKQTAERQLRETWGADYETNVNVIKGMVNQLPESVREDFMSARLANGQSLFSSPEMALFFADMGRKLNPAGTVVPNSDNPLQSINEEIKKLESQMGSDAWYKDADAQKRYQDLISARDNMKR